MGPRLQIPVRSLPKQQIPLLSCVLGADIAEVMLDFIDWLTHQEFGRRCVVSIRDILSWVNFMNTMGEEAALKRPETISTVTSFVHAACLVYVDGIGSGMLSVSWWEQGVRVEGTVRWSKPRPLSQIPVAFPRLTVALLFFYSS